jgi:hypothetical protein
MDGSRGLPRSEPVRHPLIKIGCALIGMSGWLISGLRNHISGLVQVATLAAPQRRA